VLFRSSSFIILEFSSSSKFVFSYLSSTIKTPCQHENMQNWDIMVMNVNVGVQSWYCMHVDCIYVMFVRRCHLLHIKCTVYQHYIIWYSPDLSFHCQALLIACVA